jgi:hypothetical protein
VPQEAIFASEIPRDLRPWAPKAPKATEAAAEREPMAYQGRDMVDGLALDVGCLLRYG